MFKFIWTKRRPYKRARLYYYFITLQCLIVSATGAVYSAIVSEKQLPPQLYHCRDTCTAGS